MENHGSNLENMFGLEVMTKYRSPKYPKAISSFFSSFTVVVVSELGAVGGKYKIIELEN